MHESAIVTKTHRLWRGGRHWDDICNSIKCIDRWSLLYEGRSRPLLQRISSAHAIHDMARATPCISSARTESETQQNIELVTFAVT